MQRFAFATILLNGMATPAVVIDERYIPFPAELLARYGDLKSVFRDWDAAFSVTAQFAESVASGARRATSFGESEVLLDTPIRFPNKVLATGGNYAAHLREAGFRIERIEPLPIFLKPPTTCVVGPGKTVRKPKATNQFDWEVELAVVMGRRVSRVDLEEAAAAIAGYTIGVDLSARDLLAGVPPLGMDVVRGKCQDTMAPIGPVILPSSFVNDPNGLDLELSVNGRVMQKGTTADMIVPPREIVSAISQCVTLEPGDVILTGTPEGTGMHHGYFLKAGDVIQARIEGLGTLAVEVYE